MAEKGVPEEVRKLSEAKMNPPLDGCKPPGMLRKLPGTQSEFPGMLRKFPHGVENVTPRRVRCYVTMC